MALPRAENGCQMLVLVSQRTWDFGPTSQPGPLRLLSALQAASQQLFLLLHWQVRKGVWEQNLSVCSFPEHPHFHPHTTAPTKSSWGNAGPGCLEVF